MTGSRIHRMKGEGVRKTTELSGSDGPWQAGRKWANESVDSDWGEWALGLFMSLLSTAREEKALTP
jgi:hypothetical protein